MKIPSMGYIPDVPSIQDYSVETEHVNERLAKLGEQPVAKMLKEIGVEEAQEDLPSSVKLHQWFSDIEDQGQIGSCTAQAQAGLLEYSENRATGSYTNISRLYIYKMSRILAGLTGDSGSYLRTTMQAVATLGVPPEQYMPYTDDPVAFDAAPTPFCFAIAQNYRPAVYFRLDSSGVTPDELLKRIKTNLAAGISIMFGFPVYSSYVQGDTTGKIPFPVLRDRLLGGHAVVAAGYDDDMIIRNSASPRPTIGALAIRNSWGMSWGDRGYGWLPYDYVLWGLAVDFWCVLKASWIDSGKFKL